MLRIHCVQLFYNLSDPGMEDMLYEVESRRFVGLRLPGPLPDETTILNFRHLLEEHALGSGLFEEINRYRRLQEGTIVDASIIAAPSSTKNRAKERDPEMHQTKKGNEWHFGMKVHIGVDSQTGVVHSMTTTSANHDLTELPRCTVGSLSQGVDKRPATGASGRMDPASVGSWSLRVRRSAKRRSELRWSIRSCTSSGTSATGPLQGTVQGSG